MHVVGCIDLTVDSHVAALRHGKRGKMSILCANFHPRSSRISFNSRHSLFPSNRRQIYVFDQPRFWINHLQKLSRTTVLKAEKQ